MEIVHTSEYPSFISSLLRCFVELLKNRLTPQVRCVKNVLWLVETIEAPQDVCQEGGICMQEVISGGVPVSMHEERNRQVGRNRYKRIGSRLRCVA